MARTLAADRAWPVELHRSADELAAGLDEVRRAPSRRGTVDLVVRRAARGAHELLDAGRLDAAAGLVGDDWSRRPSRSGPDGGPDPDKQVTLVGTRAARLVAGDDEARRAGFGDQFHVDLDLSEAAVPPGTRLRLGGAVVEVTAAPHRGCATFRDRFGTAALRAVNTPDGMALHLRGVNARVVEPGPVRRGDVVERVH